MDGRYNVICTGSLLGIKGYREQTASIPVGYETEITMCPLDFEEFLWANGISDAVINGLSGHIAYVTAVPEVIHNRLRKLLLQ